MPAVANTVLFRIAQEALTNIARHSQATQINVLLQGDAQAITLTVQDNGVGFDVDQIDGNPKRGIGLRNMVERLEAIGGTLRVSSTAAGTTVLATIPNNLPQ
jgi:two-component system NarL family sensor kinase